MGDALGDDQDEERARPARSSPSTCHASRCSEKASPPWGHRGSLAISRATRVLGTTKQTGPSPHGSSSSTKTYRQFSRAWPGGKHVVTPPTSGMNSRFSKEGGSCDPKGNSAPRNNTPTNTKPARRHLTTAPPPRRVPSSRRRRRRWGAARSSRASIHVARPPARTSNCTRNDDGVSDGVRRPACSAARWARCSPYARPARSGSRSRH